MTVPPNLAAGWALVLLGFLSGAALGTGFHRAEFLGGYGSLRRRLLRLGHIACIALGMLNLLFVATRNAVADDRLAGWLLIAGAVAMPLACLVTAWRPSLRALFVAPVTTLVAGAALILVDSIAKGATP